MAVTVTRLKDFVSIMPSGGVVLEVYDPSSNSNLYGISSSSVFIRDYLYGISSNIKTITDTTGIKQAQYAIRLAYNVNDDVEYAGYGAPGTLNSASSWRVLKFYYNGAMMTGQRFADGNANFDNVWNDRESLSYS